MPPHKEAPEDPGGHVRLGLCEAAIAADARFEVCGIELERAGPSYTVDTLRLLSDQAPEDELIFIAGGDMARSLPSWREPEQVLSMATFAVAERAGAARIDVSSSDVRRRVAEGRPIRYLVPDAVAGEIERQGLYR